MTDRRTNPTALRRPALAGTSPPLRCHWPSRDDAKQTQQPLNYQLSGSSQHVSSEVSALGEALLRLFEGLPRQGPGSDACTREALRRLPELPAAPRVLDLGCGSGRSALVLAQMLRVKIVAVDTHRPFLDQLRATARERGLEHLIETRCADMAAPGVPPGSVDLLWSEGAIYFL
jgi:SAM-dependent methyltransferase